MDWDRYTIVGSSQQLFKDYLRLTSVSVIDYLINIEGI